MCKTPVKAGLEVITDSPTLRAARQITVELIVAEHHTDCLSCLKNTRCKLQMVVNYIGMEDWRLNRLQRLRTICPHCGCGCGLLVGVRGNAIVSVQGDYANPVNKGRLCVKGRFGFGFITHPKRLKSPLIKREANGKLIEASWEDALTYIAAKLSEYRCEPANDNNGLFAFIASAKCTNDENYLMQKFTRAVMHTNNIDHCARLCHAHSVAGLAQTFGSGAITNSIAEFSDAACIFAIGTNTAVAHPIIALQLKRAVRQRGATLIVANPRRINLCGYADIFLQHRPGTMYHFLWV